MKEGHFIFHIQCRDAVQILDYRMPCINAATPTNHLNLALKRFIAGPTTEKISELLLSNRSAWDYRINV